MRILQVTAITALICIGLLAATVLPVGAQEAPVPDNSGEHVKGYDDWHFSFELGEWLPAFSGSVTSKGKSSPVDLTLIDELSLLNTLVFVLGGRVEVSKGPWGFFIDGFYIKANQSASNEKDIQIPILDPPSFTLRGNADITGVYSVGETALSYDVYASHCLVANMPELTVAVLGGARDTYLRSIVDLEISALGRSKTFASDKSTDWVDPFVGGRVLWRPGEKWSTSLKTEFGGFTVNSDFLFNMDLEAKYKINKWYYADFGYSVLYTDYETGIGNNRYAYNIWNYGPFVGVGVEF